MVYLSRNRTVLNRSGTNKPKYNGFTSRGVNKWHVALLHVLTKSSWRGKAGRPARRRAATPTGRSAPPAR
ncbi:hypothetical protein CBM2626_A120016 [Cupriavidus taiwanensis]|nr:hypothetical protein CBM2626_A120016 [Cupriavidus taiwanensis]